MTDSTANGIVNGILPKELRRRLKHYLPRTIARPVEKFRYLSAMRRGTDSYEPEMDVIKKLFRRGDCVADLGASVGWYTRFLSDRVGPGGLVCSFEPNIDNFEVLSFIKRKLRLDNVDVYNVAVSNSYGKALMVVPRNGDTGEPDSYRTQVVTPDSGEAPGDPFSIQTGTLDGLAHREFNFIKCDVEGHELEVLHGASAVLASGPAWMMEVWGHPDQDHRARETFTRMSTAGYKAFILDEEGTSVRPRKPGEVGIRGNYFFLQGKHIPLLELQV
jgi:FkbM family methyltransferase